MTLHNLDEHYDEEQFDVSGDWIMIQERTGLGHHRIDRPGDPIPPPAWTLVARSIGGLVWGGIVFGAGCAFSLGCWIIVGVLVFGIWRRLLEWAVSWW